MRLQDLIKQKLQTNQFNVVSCLDIEYDDLEKKPMKNKLLLTINN